MLVRARACVFAVVLVVRLTAVAEAQDPADPAQPTTPEPSWTTSLAAGVSLTGGNTSTVTTNLAFTVESDKTARNVFKAEGLNLRSSQDGDAIVDRTSLQAQDDFTLGARIYAFGRLQYLRDVFKGIDYLVSPGVGVGYKFVENMRSTISADVAFGAVAEKNPDIERRTAGAVTATQKASVALSPSATFTQSVSVLWKTSDYRDSLATFQAGLTTAITRRIQLKVDFLDTFKNQPPDALLKKNDTALILSFAFTF